MKNIRICSVVRFYDEEGNYSEQRYDNVSYEDFPKDTLKDIISGEVICVQITPNVEAYYFEKPKDWPENWTQLGGDN